MWPQARCDNGGQVEAAPIILAHEKPFRIGHVTFLPARREVQWNGKNSVVEPRVMQLLVALKRASGEVVTKDELLQQCWNGRVVGDDAINRVVSRLRSVADKQAGGQFRIETITKVGYRLAAPTDGTPSRVQTIDGTSPNSGISRRGFVVGGSVLAAATVAGIGWTMLSANRLPPEARTLVDDARNSLYQFTPDQIENAVGKLRRATQIAPDSAEAWGLLALAYANSTYSAPTDQRANRFARSKDSRRRAFSIEPLQPDALAAELGTSRVFRHWYSQEQRCRGALGHHPNHPVLHVALGHLLLEVGRLEDALGHFEASLQKTPLCVTSLSSRIVILSGLGRFEEADAALANAFALMPRQPAIWFTRLNYLAFTGRAVEAAAMIADNGSRPVGISDATYDLTAMQANSLMTGNQAEIRRTVEAYSKAARRGSTIAENAALFAAFVGSAEETFRILDALYFNRGFTLADVHSDTEHGMYSFRERRTSTLFRFPMARVRGDAQFSRLTRELGLDAYWMRTGSRPQVIA